jgi:hypothetical protein
MAINFAVVFTKMSRHANGRPALNMRPLMMRQSASPSRGRTAHRPPACLPAVRTGSTRARSPARSKPHASQASAPTCLNRERAKNLTGTLNVSARTISAYLGGLIFSALHDLKKCVYNGHKPLTYIDYVLSWS